MNKENIDISDISDISMSPLNEKLVSKYNSKDNPDISISDLEFSEKKQ